MICQKLSSVWTNVLYQGLHLDHQALPTLACDSKVIIRTASMNIPVLRFRSAFLLTAVLIVAFAVSGCSLLPQEVRDWLSESPEQQQNSQMYGWEGPSENKAQHSENDWSEQSWSDGPPVNYQPQPLLEDEKREPKPEGPVVNSPVRRLEKTEEKLSNLEIEVASLRRDFNAVLPAIRQLMARREKPGKMPEKNHLRSRSPKQGQLPSPGQNKSADAEPPSKKERRGGYPGPYLVPGQDRKKTPETDYHSAAASSVKNLRFGEHGNKTRVVLDLEKPTTYSYRVDQNNSYIEIELPEASWNGPVRGMLNKSPIFTGYSVQQIPGSGSRLLLQLRKPAKVVFADQLSPNSTYRNYRIFFDVVPR